VYDFFFLFLAERMMETCGDCGLFFHYRSAWQAVWDNLRWEPGYFYVSIRTRALYMAIDLFFLYVSIDNKEQWSFIATVFFFGWCFAEDCPGFLQGATSDTSRGLSVFVNYSCCMYFSSLLYFNFLRLIYFMKKNEIIKKCNILEWIMLNHDFVFFWVQG
jgi:hypothetical protein